MPESPGSTGNWRESSSACRGFESLLRLRGYCREVGRLQGVARICADAGDLVRATARELGAELLTWTTACRRSHVAPDLLSGQPDRYAPPRAVRITRVG